MQRFSLNPRLDRIPQPVSISFRQKKDRTQPQITPYRVQPNAPVLQSIDNTMDSGLGTMKIELSNIRREVEKIGFNEGNQKLNTKQNSLTQSLKLQIIRLKTVEVNLRDEIEILKDNMKENQNKQEIRNRQQEGKYIIEKQEFQRKILDLETQLSQIAQKRLQDYQHSEGQSIHQKLQFEKFHSQKLASEVQIQKKSIQTLNECLKMKEKMIFDLTNLVKTHEASIFELKTQIRQRQRMAKRLNEQVQDIGRDSELRLKSAMYEVKKLEKVIIDRSQQTTNCFLQRIQSLQLNLDTLEQQNILLKKQNSGLRQKFNNAIHHLSKFENQNFPQQKPGQKIMNTIKPVNNLNTFENVNNIEQKQSFSCCEHENFNKEIIHIKNHLQQRSQIPEKLSVSLPFRQRNYDKFDQFRVYSIADQKFLNKETIPLNVVSCQSNLEVPSLNALCTGNYPAPLNCEQGIGNGKNSSKIQKTNCFSSQQ